MPLPLLLLYSFAITTIFIILMSAPHQNYYIVQYAIATADSINIALQL